MYFPGIIVSGINYLCLKYNFSWETILSTLMTVSIYNLSAISNFLGTKSELYTFDIAQILCWRVNFAENISNRSCTDSMKTIITGNGILFMFEIDSMALEKFVIVCKTRHWAQPLLEMLQSDRERERDRDHYVTSHET